MTSGTRDRDNQRSYDVRRSSRDPAALRGALEGWLHGRLGHAADPRVDAMSGTEANGMSSDTTLFTASWSDGREREQHHLVARLAPDPGDVPVFPSYDLRLQWDVITLVRDTTRVPVPSPRWFEADPAWLGTPFFVMDRVAGEVPPDNLPYTFGGNWLAEAAPVKQQELQDATVDAIADLHDIPDPAGSLPGLERDEPGDSPLRRHVVHTRAWYALAEAAGTRSALVERTFDWLDRHWPEESRPVLSWGDARIGNVIYRDFRPVALLDWEMAGIGPAELDVGWLVCSHIVLNDLARALDLPGLPGFLRQADVVGRYESRRDVRLGDLQWYVVYAALQWAIVFLRTGVRQMHFAGQSLPEDVESMIYCRSTLESLLAG